MGKSIETSFGARLRSLENAAQILRLWPDYNPASADIKLPALKAFITSVIAANNLETTSKAQYTTSVGERRKFYSEKGSSMTFLLSSIRGAVEELYGRGSAEAKAAISIIAKMRATKLVTLPKDPANPDAAQTVSQSQQSFGSKAQYFADLVTTLGTFNNYTSARTETSLPALQQMVDDVRTANNMVAQNIGSLKLSRTTRNELYEKMEVLGQKIKDNAKNTWTVKSSQYKTLVALGI